MQFVGCQIPMEFNLKKMVNCSSLSVQLSIRATGWNAQGLLSYQP